MMPQSPSKWAPWYFTQFSQLPSAALLYFPESHQQSEISSLSKVILVPGKARSHRVPNLGCRGVESPGWFDVLPKNSARDVRRARAHCRDEAANFWISEEFPWRKVQAEHEIWCRFVARSVIWMWRPHRTHAHSMVSTVPTDRYSEVILVHTCAFQSPLLGCQVSSMSCKLFSLD